MFRFFQGGSTSLSDQDVEMAIERELTQTSAHTTSYPPVSPPKGTEMMPVDRQPPTHTPTIPHQNIEPETLAFIEQQQTVINGCMEQMKKNEVIQRRMEQQLADMRTSADERISEAEHYVQRIEEAMQEATERASQSEQRARELEKNIAAWEEQQRVDSMVPALQLVVNSNVEPIEESMESARSIPDKNARDSNKRLDDYDMDEGPFNDNQHPAIPKPMKFFRPRGGAPKPNAHSETTEQSSLKTLLAEIRKTQSMVMEFTNQRSGHQKLHIQRPREFKSPPKRNRDADRTETLSWLRRIMNELMQIKHDKDVLDDDDLYEPNTPKKRKMASYEKNQDMPGPDLQPMSPNWDELYGKWNEELFKLFISYCEENGEGDEIRTDEDQYNIHEMFMDRLQRLKNLIKRCRPKGNEHQDVHAARLKLRKEDELKRQRHHSRRGELFDVRLAITLGHLPDSLDDQGTEETAIWRNSHMVLDALGAGGISSDESDMDDSGRSVYQAKTMAWRGKDILRKLTDIDNNRNMTNAYGNIRAGNPPRVRKRRDRLGTSRKAIPGLPRNFYDSDWYASLTPGQKRELAVKGEMPLLFN